MSEFKSKVLLLRPVAHGIDMALCSFLFNRLFFFLNDGTLKWPGAMCIDQVLSCLHIHKEWLWMDF